MALEEVVARRRLRLQIEGLVQGVGFRPFVFTLAERFGVAGFAANDRHGVIVEVEGDEPSLSRFVDDLVAAPPPLARIERIARRAIPPRGERVFTIAASDADGERHAAVAADAATCADCLHEIFDPNDRRYRYPFTNCVNCGPRFTIVRDVPYDRGATTMAEFALCTDCRREYGDPTDRRFHAEPISCPACGPRLSLRDDDGRTPDDHAMTDRAAEPALAAAIAYLANGAIVAVKGLGGYHLAVLASDDRAVTRLRARKHRDAKPFAVMVADLVAARRLAEVDAVEARLLEGGRRPIVLLHRRSDAPIAAAVAPDNRALGIMLPYTPLHHLLLAGVGAPLVLTSGNVSDEPIAFRDADAFERLSGIADCFLTHDRPIHTRVDDSVVRVVRGREVPLRRSRGYAPQPLRLPRAARRPVLACGAELKNTFCLVKDERAFLSHHIGDLENFATLTAFREGIEHFRRLFAVAPALVAYDLHPDYLSSQYALELDGVERIGVQHHHAHIAACLADNGEPGPVLGVAFDGLGHGLDGTLWGGEILLADLCGFRRVAHLEPVPMPGGTAAIRQPWRMAAAYLDATFGDTLPAPLAIVRRHDRDWTNVLRLSRRRRFSPLTSSAGRLFDTAASVIGLRDVIRYEAEAAIALEQVADPNVRDAYTAQLIDGEPMRLRGADLIAALVDDLCRDTPHPVIAARFHNGVACLIATACTRLAARHGLSTVALSGGVFQNLLLLHATMERLQSHGLRVLTHSHVPANDAGISFGQAAIAVARDACAGGAGAMTGYGPQGRSDEGDVTWEHS